MEKEDLAIEIYYEMDMLRMLSKLIEFAIKNDAGDLELEDLALIFRDIHKRSDQISELTERLARYDDPLFPKQEDFDY